MQHTIEGERRPASLAGADLDLSLDQMKELLDATVSYILRYQADLLAGKYPASYLHDSINVSEYEQGKQIGAELRENAVPEVGTDLDVLLSEIFDKAIASGTVHPHPGFMAHVPSGGLFQGAVGDFIARTLNRFAGVWVASPGLIQLESNVIRWFCTMLGYGDGSFGYLTTGGSIANFMGMLCGRHRSEQIGGGLPVIYTSGQGHFSVKKAARMLGIAPSRIRLIATHADYSMNAELLAERIALDRAQGFSPACVVATAGTTNTGAIDDLGRIGAICREQGVWLHVDACFGGFFRITQRGKVALAGIEEADSIAVDAHKSLFLPHGISALLVKNRAHLKATFEIPDAAYMPGFPDEHELVDFCNYGPELSREIRGLTAWLPIKLHGIGAFERCLDEKLDLVEYLAERLTQLDGVEVIRMHPLHLPVVTFKLCAANGADTNDLNHRLCELVSAQGNVYLTTTMLPGHGLVVRVCILHHRTDRAIVDQLLADVELSISSLIGDPEVAE